MIVVGAGLAGLNAARHVRRAGRSVLVLEARSKVGGRTRTRLLQGEVADFGAEWIGWAHRRVGALAAELGARRSRREMPAIQRYGGYLPPGHGADHNTVIGGEQLSGAWRRGDRVTGFAPPPSDDLSDHEIQADLARAFNVAAGDLRAPIVFRWAHEPHIPGCDVAFAPGEPCRYGPLLARPHGRLHFAGAERSSWPNNMEGALESGERAAREAITTSRTQIG